MAASLWSTRAYDKRHGRSGGRDLQIGARRRPRFPSFEHVEHETLHWIGFYNEERLHEELGDLPPDSVYETQGASPVARSRSTFPERGRSASALLDQIVAHSSEGMTRAQTLDRRRHPG